MAGQQVPGPQGVYSGHPLAFVDGGTLARAATPYPGISGCEFPVASESADVYRSRVAVFSEDEKLALEKVVTFCREVEDGAFIHTITKILTENDLEFGDVPGGDNACWDPRSNRITINQSFIERVNGTDPLQSTVDLAATLAHELEHRRQGRLTWALGASADANRTIGESYALHAAQGLLLYWGWVGVGANVAGYGVKQIANWTIGNVNQGERSAWQVGLQKRLTWARSQSRRLKQLQSRNALQKEKEKVAKRLKAICDDFQVTYQCAGQDVRAQIGDLELATEEGKTLPVSSAQQEMTGYLGQARQVLQESKSATKP
ncbi:MAG TPA: hypothetical protein DCS21_02450 [Gammaproteobacteria bacterium]|nr:hypothetical protein [Gammaproteobacteria bacterium]